MELLAMGRLLLAAVFSATLVHTAHASLYGESNLNHTCALVLPQLSCSPQAQANVTDSCCSETYGGLVLSTQFWDTYTGLESQGQVLPKDSWSMHGTWPDFCNGSYTQYCDLSRQYDPFPSPNTTTGLANGTAVPAWTGPSIDTFITPFGAHDLLAFMKKYWIAQNQANAVLWAHEFSKHATCFSTFDTPCFGPLAPEHSDVLNFFETSVSYFLTLPTWGWLTAAGIKPSNTTTTSLSKLQGALTDGFGALPYIGCSGVRYNNTEAGIAAGSNDTGFTRVSEVWYYYHVYGRVQGRQGLPVNASINGGSVSNCAKVEGALHYSERGLESEI